MKKTTYMALIITLFCLSQITYAYQNDNLQITTRFACKLKQTSTMAFQHILISVIRNKDSVMKSYIKIGNTNFHSSGEFHKQGMVFVGPSNNGHWVTIFASWSLLKGGFGHLEFENIDGDSSDVSYVCKPI